MKTPPENSFVFYRSPWLYKLLAVFILAITLPVTAVSFRASLRERESTLSHELSELNVTSRRIAGDIDRYLATNQNIVRYLALHSELRELVRQQKSPAPSPDFNHWLRQQAAISAESAALYVLSTDGICIASTEPSFLNQNYSIRYYFREAMKGKAYKSDWTVGLTSNEPGIYLTSPISDNNTVVGVLVLKMRVDQIVRLASVWKDQERDTYIINESGIILFHTIAQFQYSPLDELSDSEKKHIQENRQFAGQEKPSLHLPAIRAGLDRALQTGQTEVVDYILMGRPKFSSLSPLREQKWIVGTSIPKDAIYAKSEPVLRDTVAFCLLSIAAAAALGLFVNRSFSKPVVKIADILRNFGAGDHKLRAVVADSDEVGHLANSFNLMAESICASHKDFETKQELAAQELEHLRLQLGDRNARDPLTGCFGRPYLFEQLTNEIARSRKHVQPLCLIACSLNDLQSINAKHGHAAGDSVLQTVAGLLTDSTRKNLDWVARYDGDAFLAVLPQFKLDQAIKLAARIRTRVREHDFEVGVYQALKVGVFLGVVESKGSSDGLPTTPDRLLAIVETLVRRAKSTQSENIPVETVD